SVCALTVHDARVDYKYTKAPAADFASSPEKIRVGNFEDSRGMDNPRIIMHSKNMYGNTMSGGTQAEKPVAEIVRDGVVQGLTTGTANTKLMLKLKLTSKTGNTIWSDTLLGKASYHAAMNPGEDALFRLTLDDLVERLQKNEDFQHALHVQ